MATGNKSAVKRTRDADNDAGSTSNLVENYVPNRRQVGQQNSLPEAEIGALRLGFGLILRVSLTSYKGRRLISIRRWYETSEGYRPTREGINLSVENLPDLHRFVGRAMKRARKEGSISQTRSE